MSKIDAEKLPILLRYEPETGELFWLSRHKNLFATEQSAMTWNARFAGVRAFTALNNCGYRRGTIWGQTYLAHRVIWALVMGYWPHELIDHINGDKTDNRWNNLRCATQAENLRNQGTRSDNTSGFKGVSWKKRLRRWQANIRVSGVQMHLGYFDDAEEAHAAYVAAAEKHYGKFARAA